MPDKASIEPLLVAGGGVSLVGFLLGWFVVPTPEDAFGYSPSDSGTSYGAGELGTFPWFAMFLLFVGISVLGLWARRGSVTANVTATYACFVIITATTAVAVVAGRVASVTDDLNRLQFVGVVPLAVGLALILAGAIQVVGRAGYRSDLDYLSASMVEHGKRLRQLEG